jgi:hypothetical protein
LRFAGSGQNAPETGFLDQIRKYFSYPFCIAGGHLVDGIQCGSPFSIFFSKKRTNPFLSMVILSVLQGSSIEDKKAQASL